MSRGGESPVVVALHPPLLGTALTRALTIAGLAVLEPSAEEPGAVTEATVGVVAPQRRAEVVAEAVIELCPLDQCSCWVEVRGVRRSVRVDGLEALEQLVRTTLRDVADLKDVVDLNDVAAPPPGSTPPAAPPPPPPAGSTPPAW